MCPAVRFEEDRWDGRVPLGDVGIQRFSDDMEGSHWIAEADGHRRAVYGAGMMATFRRGDAEVFNSGTSEWVAGLIHRDWFVERVTVR